jgi:hypothetical protein
MIGTLVAKISNVPFLVKVMAARMLSLLWYNLNKIIVGRLDNDHELDHTKTIQIFWLLPFYYILI